MKLPTPSRKAGANRTVGVAAAVIAAFMAGMVVRGFVSPLQASSHDVAPNAPHPTRAPASLPGPARYVDGVPSGFGHTEDGARAAAAAYVLIGQHLMEVAPTRATAAVRAVSAGGTEDARVADTEHQLRRLRGVLNDGNGPIRYQQAVLATRLDAYAIDRARVSVWSVGVLSRLGAAEPQAGWTTSAFELVWEDEDWKLWSEVVTSGPVPALNAGAAPVTSDQLEQALNGFVPWGVAQ